MGEDFLSGNQNSLITACLKFLETMTELESRPTLSPLISHIAAQLPAILGSRNEVSVSIQVDGDEFTSPDFHSFKYCQRFPITLGQIGRGGLDLYSDKKINDEWYLLVQFILNQISLSLKSRDTKAQLAKMIESAPEYILIADQRGRVLNASFKVAELLGFQSSDDLKGIEIYSYIQQSERKKALAAFRELLKSEDLISFETILNSESSIPLPLEIKGRSLNAGRTVQLVIRDISDRKSLEEGLRESEDRYRQLIEDINDVIYEIDREGKVVYISPRIKDLIGYDSHFLKGREIFTKISEEHRNLMKSVFDGTNKNRYCFFEARYIHKDNYPVWLRISLKPVFTNANITGGRGTLTDITALKETEMRLLDREIELENLINFQTTFVVRVDLTGRIIYANNQYINTFGWIFKEKGEAVIGSLKETTVIPEDRRKVVEALQFCQDNPGTITKVETRKPTRDRSVMTTLWDYISLTDSDGRVSEVQCIGIDISDRIEMEMLARKNEEKYRTLFDNSPEGYLIMRKNKILECNETAASMLGYTKEDLIGQSPADISPGNQPDYKDSGCYGQEHGNRKDWRRSFSWVHTAKNGSHLTFHVNQNPIEYEGKPTLLVTWRDITRQRVTEEQLKILSQAVEQSPMEIIITGVDRKIIYVNEELCLKTGYSRQELIGVEPGLLNAGDITAEDYEKIGEKLKQGKTWNGVFRNRKKNGETYWISSSISSVLNRQGDATHYVSINEDITERIAMSRELEVREERLIQATEVSRSMIWECTLDGLYTYVSPAIKNILGYEASDIIGSTYFWELTPEELREEVKAAGLGALSSSNLLDNYDSPRSHLNGSIVWVSTSGCPVRDSRGRITGYRGADIDITERRQTAEWLKMFRNVVEQANYGVVIANPEGSIIFANKAWGLMHEMEEDEVYGTSLMTFLSTGKSHEGQDFIQALQSRGSFMAEEVWHRTGHGMDFPTLMNSKLIYDEENRPLYIAVTAVDITETKKRDLEIIKLNTALEQSPVPVIITDLEGTIEYASPVIKEVTGYDRQEIMGETSSVFQSGVTSESLYRELWATIQSGHVWRGTLNNRRKNGEIYPASLVICPAIDEQGKTVNYIAVMNDLTMERRAEEEQTARIAAEKANRAKSVFLSNMSHEIRTPLNAIIGFSQLMLNDSSIVDDQKKRLNTIFRSGEHLLNLINDILDISKIESGQVAVHNGDFCLRALLEDLELMFRFQARGKNLDFLVRGKSDLPEYIHGDEKKIRQILINLLGNALKFTENGQIILHLFSQETETGIQIRIEVEDTGSGISPEDQEHIFDSFSQTRGGRDAGGTGLGLAISRNLARLMGGRLTLDSTRGRGSTFALILPVGAAQNAAAEDRETDYSRALLLDESSRPCRVIIADDVEVNRMLLLELLEPLGFETRTAEEGAQTLEILSDWKADTVLMDLRMPGMDGYEATKAIHRLYGDDFPVIAITASAFEEENSDVDLSIFSGYIKKPFRLHTLLKLLHDLLGVEYLFQENAADAADQKGRYQLRREDILRLPLSYTDKLKEAVEMGDIHRMKEIVSDLTGGFPDIAAALEELMARYDYESLLYLLEIDTEDEE